MKILLIVLAALCVFFLIVDICAIIVAGRCSRDEERHRSYESKIDKEN
jgi:hypothetical protein